MWEEVTRTIQISCHEVAAAEQRDKECTSIGCNWRNEKHC